MKFRFAFALSIAPLCWLLVTSLPDSAESFAGPLRAAREFCMDGGELLLATFALIDLRFIVALVLPPLLISAASFIWWQLRTGRVIVDLLRTQVRPLPGELQEHESRLNIEGRVHLVESEQPLAFCAGSLRPHVFLTTGLLDRLSPPELEAVLRHEACHLSCRDPLITALGHAAGRGFFLVPKVHLLLERLRARREVQADDAAIEAMGTPYPLASALNKALRWSVAQAEVGAGAFSALDARIDHLLTRGADRPNRRHRTLLSVLSIAAAVLIVCAVAVASSVVASVSAAVCGAC